MMLSRECCGVVILAGGRSRRMGTCKALLTIEGETMLSRLTRQLDDFQEKLLSTNTPALAEGLPLTPVPDFYPGAGPLAGLHAAEVCKVNAAPYSRYAESSIQIRNKGT